MARFRFAEQDRERYGDRWYEVDVFRPADIDAGIIERWEETTDFRLFGDFTERLERKGFKVLRATCWLAYLIGDGQIDWPDFKPQVHLIEWDRGEPQGEEPGPNRATRRARTPSGKASRSAPTSKSTTSA